FVLVDQHPSPAAGAARSAGTALPSPPPDPRRARAKAREIDARDRTARVARRRRERSQYPRQSRPRLILRLILGPIPVAVVALPWHAGAWQERGNPPESEPLAASAGRGGGRLPCTRARSRRRWRTLPTRFARRSPASSRWPSFSPPPISTSAGAAGRR